MHVRYQVKERGPPKLVSLVSVTRVQRGPERFASQPQVRTQEFAVVLTPQGEITKAQLQQGIPGNPSGVGRHHDPTNLQLTLPRDFRSSRLWTGTGECGSLTASSYDHVRI